MTVELVLPRHEPDSSRFIVDDPRGAAVLEYRIDGDQVDFTHTFVPPTLRGTGVAARLVQAGLAWAGQAGLSPVASCSYVAGVLARRKN